MNKHIKVIIEDITGKNIKNVLLASKEDIESTHLEVNCNFQNLLL